MQEGMKKRAIQQNHHSSLLLLVSEVDEWKLLSGMLCFIRPLITAIPPHTHTHTHTHTHSRTHSHTHRHTHTHTQRDTGRKRERERIQKAAPQETEIGRASCAV